MGIPPEKSRHGTSVPHAARSFPAAMAPDSAVQMHRTSGQTHAAQRDIAHPAGRATLMLNGKKSRPFLQASQRSLLRRSECQSVTLVSTLFDRSDALVRVQAPLAQGTSQTWPAVHPTGPYIIAHRVGDRRRDALESASPLCHFAHSPLANRPQEAI